MGHVKTTRGRTTRAILATCTAALSLLAFSTPVALADPPSHTPVPSLDLEGLSQACGAATDTQGDLYASSPGSDEIKLYGPAPTRTELTSIANANDPCGLAVDSKGNLYVSETATGKVLRYHPTTFPFAGTPTYEAPTTIDASGNAKGIAVDRTDDRLYVAEGNRVAVYDSKAKLGVDEVQSVNVSGCTGGSFKLKFKGKETAPIACGASAVAVEEALKALTTIGAGNVEVKKPVSYLVTFTGALASTDVEMLVGDGSALTPGTAKVTIAEATRGFSGFVGEGTLTDATGVAAYTYIYTEGPVNLKRHYYLYVADAATDQVKTFAAKEGDALKLRKTIIGVDADENPQTPDQSFGFGTEGAYLAADPGNESRATRGCAQIQVEGQDQACTQGRFFLYDAANEAVDEFDATGEFVDQITNGAFADAEPTALAVERSGTSSDGTLYVGAGASSGAKLVAFRPLMMPARDPLPALSRALVKAGAVATDCNGYVYVAAEATVHVYSPEGEELTSFTDAERAADLAVDCEGNVYVVDTEPAEDVLTYYSPSEYPPSATTSYTRAEPPLIPEIAGEGPKAVAVNPANGHAFALGVKGLSAAVFEFGPVAEGSPFEGECGTGLIGSSLSGKDIDVYGPTGEVYLTMNPTVLSTLHCEGAPELLVRQIKGGGCPSGEFNANMAIAVDQSNGHVIEFEPGQSGNSAREYDSSGSCVAEFGTFSSSTGGFKVAVDSSCAVHDPPLSEQTTPKCSSLYPSNGNAYVAFDSANNGVQPYDVTAFGPLEYPPPPGEPPTVVTGGADGFGPGEATLHGEVNPNSSQIEECWFEYLTETKYQENGEGFTGAEEEECAESPEAIGNGGKPVPVHADIEGLQIGTAYRYRLLAANEFDTGEGEAKPLTLKAPGAEAKSALPVSYVEATLRGEVDPAGAPSSYRFEYLTQAEYEENEAEPFATAQSTPVKELPGTEGAVAVKAPLTGLQEGTEYRFRLLAENAVGSDSEEGPAFETLVRPAPQVCANAEYRTGLGAFLPDCRAYELATPAQTFSTAGGLRPLGTFTSTAGHRFANSWFVAPRGPGAGESLSFQANVAHIDGHIFRARRGEGDHPKEGWQSEPYGFSFAQAASAGGEPGGVSADQRYFLHEILAYETPTAEAFPVGSYLRVPAGEASRACAPEPKAQFEASDAEAAFELVGCGSKGTDSQAEGRFVSAAGTHVIFSSKEELEQGSPAAGTEAIYDREAGKASAEVVSVDPDGLPFATGARYYATSEDGKAVVFGASGALYLHREGETTQVASSPYTYAGLSEDGKRVLFMDKVFAPVNVDELPPPAGLFACDVQAGSCTAEAKPGLKEIADESSFVNVSADGTDAFFMCKEVLTGPETNENGEAAEAGEPNLYAWDGTQIRFVAVLDPEDLDGFRKGAGVSNEEPREDLLAWTNAIPGQFSSASSSYEAGRAYSPTRSTPDGEVFAFQSHARLTGYDNGGKGEIYRYAPAAPLGSQLTCVSCDPSGAPHDSPADALFDTVVLGDINSSAMIPNITDDGQRVFFESREALLPGDANEVTDVYEWKAAGVSGPGGGTCEEARGCLALISTGQGEVPSYLFGMSADGSDVFFETPEKLAGADVIGSFSIYDARELGGIPDPPLAAPCQGDACQGQGSTPPALPATASTGQGNGNEEPKPRSCAKGKHRVKGRCVGKHRKHHRKHSKQHRANRNRGAGR